MPSLTPYIQRNATWANDVKHGDEQEVVLFPIIKAFFNGSDQFFHHDRYYPSDYTDKDADGCIIGYEIKSRSCTSTTNEIVKDGPFLNTKKLWLNEYIIFNFLDKVYYWKVESDLIKTFKRNRCYVRDTRADGYVNKADDITYIPFDKLCLLHTWSPMRKPHVAEAKLKERRVLGCLIDISSL